MLYRKYRPQTFTEVVGQEHVTRTLRGALSTDRVGHAYLFAGPRGTGKTTLARVMAKAVNCTSRARDGDPCNACESCVAMNEGRSLDLIEIDAASNRGIDDVRALKETAATATSGSAYKVFIVDEVHMLTKDAFNALLKVLEEPPPHVMFLLATTEAHKVLPTVLSRVQRFDVKRLTPEQIAGKLEDIAKTEKFGMDEGARMAIARASDGSLRDAEVMLSKVIIDAPNGKVSEDTVLALLGLVPATWHGDFVSALVKGDRADAIAQLARVQEAGVDADYYCKGLLEHTRDILMRKISPDEGTAQLAADIDGKYLVRMIQAFTLARREIKSSPLPYLPLELVAVELTEPKQL
jgi:DNA polymerase-3 subunit gamma/tau